MRRRKFGIGLKIASLLTTLAVVSVGLASWIITVPTVDTPVEGGTITTETVETNSVTFSGKWLNVTQDGDNITPADSYLGEAPKMVYGVPATPDSTITDPWLTNTSIEDENLEAWLEVSASTTGSAEVSTITVKFEASDATAFDGAITGGSIGAPEFTVWKKTVTKATEEGQPDTISYEKVETTAYSSGSLEITLSGSAVHTYIIKVEFSWGTDFNGINAYNYYNKLDVATYASEAETNLTELNKLSGVSYKMTISE